MTFHELASVFAALAALAVAAGCGSSESAGGSGGSGSTGSGSTGSGGLNNDPLVGSGAATYTEANEAGNLCTTPEMVGYTLDATGLKIAGKVEAQSPTFDCFRFSAGTFEWAKVKVFVNGAARAVSVSVQCDGYSDLTNVATGARFGVIPGKSCNLTVKPGASDAGIAYSVELIGST
jgi:hypothetical protein